MGIQDLNSAHYVYRIIKNSNNHKWHDKCRLHTIMWCILYNGTIIIFLPRLYFIFFILSFNCVTWRTTYVEKPSLKLNCIKVEWRMGLWYIGTHIIHSCAVCSSLSLCTKCYKLCMSNNLSPFIFCIVQFFFHKYRV